MCATDKKYNTSNSKLILKALQQYCVVLMYDSFFYSHHIMVQNYKDGNNIKRKETLHAASRTASNLACVSGSTECSVSSGDKRNLDVSSCASLSNSA